MKQFCKRGHDRTLPNAVYPTTGACKKCDRERPSWHATEAGKSYSRKWINENPDRRKTYQLRHKYGIDLDFYNELVAEQNSRCALCGDEEELVVDHNHETGKIRGLICRPCNVGLGHFRDSPERLAAAIRYLTEV